MEKDGSRPGSAEGERSSTEAAPEVKRWSANRKKEAVLRLMRGEPVDALSRELGIEIYRLEEWSEKALQGIDTALKSRENDPLTAELDAACVVSAKSAWRTNSCEKGSGRSSL